MRSDTPDTVPHTVALASHFHVRRVLRLVFSDLCVFRLVFSTCVFRLVFRRGEPPRSEGAAARGDTGDWGRVVVWCSLGSAQVCAVPSGVQAAGRVVREKRRRREEEEKKKRVSAFILYVLVVLCVYFMYCVCAVCCIVNRRV